MISIAHKKISANHNPFIIAEMSANHNQSFDRALEMVEKAAKSGVHGLKLQTYTPDSMTLDLRIGEFFISDDKNLWSGRSLYDLYNEAYTPWEWHKPIFELARELGLIVFSSPFDEKAVDLLEELDTPCYKISSFENVDIQLIRRVAQTGKPMLISTGMATISELDETVRVARDNGCQDIILLKCTSSYPASPEDTNLLTMPHMREMFGCEVGLSDHTLGIGTALAAVALGGTVIEKHFTLSRADGGVDSAFSLEPEEMLALVKESKRAWQALGRIIYGPTETERKSIIFRRSLYFTQDMKAGDVLTTDNIRSIRPGNGLSPRFLEVILGMTVKSDIKMGTPVTWSLLK